MAKSLGKHLAAATRASAWDAIADKLERGPSGLHQLLAPTVEVPLTWPSSLVELYLVFGGGELFLSELRVLPPVEVVAEARGWRFAAIGEEWLWLTARQTILRGAAEGTPLLEGTRLDRWLHGMIDSLALLFDGKGEYVDWPEQAPDAAMARAQLRRDPKAPGPRLRLGRALMAAQDFEKARDELEAVVADLPDHAEAWLDLAHVSELLGDLDGAYEEAVTAATVAPGDDQASHAWAAVARFAQAAGRGADHAAAAQRFALAPKAAIALTEIIETARHALAAAEVPTAQYQLELARAVAADAPEVRALADAIAAALRDEN